VDLPAEVGDGGQKGRRQGGIYSLQKRTCKTAETGADQGEQVHFVASKSGQGGFSVLSALVRNLKTSEHILTATS
jgi:hypothetical protein